LAAKSKENRPPPLAAGRERVRAREASTVPRIGLTRAEAAASMGMSLTSFEQYVQPHLSIYRHGKLRIVPVAELERFLAEHSERPAALAYGREEK
jgi:hypothetical protein